MSATDFNDSPQAERMFIASNKRSGSISLHLLGEVMLRSKDSVYIPIFGLFEQDKTDFDSFSSILSVWISISL